LPGKILKESELLTDLPLNLSPESLVYCKSSTEHAKDDKQVPDQLGHIALKGCYVWIVPELIDKIVRFILEPLYEFVNKILCLFSC
jgi:hypothetical protein